MVVICKAWIEAGRPVFTLLDMPGFLFQSVVGAQPSKGKDRINTKLNLSKRIPKLNSCGQRTRVVSVQNLFSSRIFL